MVNNPPERFSRIRNTVMRVIGIAILLVVTLWFLARSMGGL